MSAEWRCAVPRCPRPRGTADDEAKALAALEKHRYQYHELRWISGVAGGLSRMPYRPSRSRTRSGDPWADRGPVW